MAATIAMTDLGNSLQFEVTATNGTNIFILNKLNMQVKQDSNYIYITDAGGFIDSALNKTIRLKFDEVGLTIGGATLYADNDAMLTAIVALVGTVSLGGGGGGGAGGGGNNTWSNAQGDFTATPTTGTKTITITGLPFTLEAMHIAEVKKYASDGTVSTLALTNVTVSGGVITLADEDDFVAGDVVRVSLFAQDKAYDEGNDNQLTYVVNPDSAKWTSSEQLVDLSAQAAATLRYVIPMEGFKDLSMHWLFSNSNAGDSITMTLWATNNPAAGDTADTNWVDISGDYLTKTLTVNNGTIEFWEMIENINPVKLMVKLVIVSAGATNAVDIFIKKKAL